MKYIVSNDKEKIEFLTKELNTLKLDHETIVTPLMRLYLPHVEARLRGIIALKAYVAS